MRLASYNVENLFNRPKVMSLTKWSDGRATLEAFAEAQALLGEAHYTDKRKARLARLLGQLGLTASDTGPYVQLRRHRGSLLKRSAGALTITAAGRADWVGGLELIQGAIQHEAVRNTARVIDLVRADVLAVVEAESRPALLAFHDEVLTPLAGAPRYSGCMLIDGNDARGIDVGLLLAQGYRLGSMRSHVDDRDARGGRLFSRDCPEYEIHTPGGQRMWLLPNHLKSKGYGSPASSNARRRVQAERVAALYSALRAAGETHIAVVGDFNDTPQSAPLQPLFATDLRSAATHPAFDTGGYPGTYGGCTASTQIDLLLLSPALFDTMQAGGIERRGMWPGVRPKKWEVLPTLTSEAEVASDHGCLWVDLAL